MKERPILFKGEMVNAILPGWKTKTRRIVKQKTLDMLDAAAKIGECMDLGSPIQDWDYVASFCPYGKPGDRLWVRETTEIDRTHDSVDLGRYSADGAQVLYQGCDDSEYDGSCAHWWYSRDTCPSIHMPRKASRILLEITDVRVERLQDISEEDARAEGVAPNCSMLDHSGCGDHGNEYIHYMRGADDFPAFSAKESFESLWQSINGPGSWNVNPWVWVVEFKRLEQ